MSLKENPCKNFAPNVFNKNKCLNCFKSRDTHLKSDKDLNKVSFNAVGYFQGCVVRKYNLLVFLG